MYKRFSPIQIIPFLILSILALLAGLWAGLLRLGWELPAFSERLVVEHGSLMVSGFLGTLIALERVAALRQRWMFAAPFLSGLGWLLALFLPDDRLGVLLITLGSLFTAAILSVMVRQEPQVYILTMAAGAFSWLVGNLFWLMGRPIFDMIWWWVAFLVLTIAGERLELSRVLGLRKFHYRLFGLAAGVFGSGVILSVVQPQIGTYLAGAGLIALFAWLLRYDIARRNVRRATGAARFIAWCLLVGYVWLGLSGLLALIFGVQVAGPYYDAILHAVFLGFVFSMIFGHALIILPALTGVSVHYWPSFYLPLILLHSSLGLRITGDLANLHVLRQWGGLLNEVAILAFIGWMVASVVYARRSGQSPASLFSAGAVKRGNR